MLGGGLAGMSKAISLLSIAISVPMTVKYLGAERYGMWMTISSLLGVLSFADLGIGAGVVSAIATSLGKDDLAAIVRLIASAFYMLAGIAIVIVAAFGASYPFIAWNRVFAVSGPEAMREAGPGVLAFVLCFAIGLPFTVVQRVQTGLQESWRSNLWQAAGAVLALAGILLAVWFKLGVIALIVAVSGGPVLASILNSALEFGSRRPEYAPKIRHLDLHTARALIGSGGMFVALQLCLVVGTGTDSIVIAQIYGAAGVSSYSVMYKLFTVATVFTLFVVPLWPAFAEALSRGDYVWARLAMNRAVTLCVSAGIALSLVLLLFSRPIVRAWAGPAVVPDMWLVGGFAAWTLVVAYGGPLTTLLNNRQFLPTQLRYFAFASMAALVLKIPMAYWIGPAGVVWTTVITYFLLYCLPAGALVRRTLDH